MPNLVGNRNASIPLSVQLQAKRDILITMQLEALGLSRRDLISTRDFKENKGNFVPTAELESRRIVNSGRIGKGEKNKLESWNNAWTSLKDDDTDAHPLQAVNEGLGQTHRAKLMLDIGVRDYTGEDSCRKVRGGKGGSGTHVGGVAAGVGRPTARAGGGKAKGERKVAFQNDTTVQPLTRVRVPKAHQTALVVESGRHPASRLKVASSTKAAKGDNKAGNLAIVSTRPPVRYEGTLAAPSAFMASVGLRSNDEALEQQTAIKSNSKEKVVAYKSHTAMNTSSVKKTTVVDKPVVSVDPPPKTNLMDIDFGQQTTQPVLQFTAPKTGEQRSRPPVESVQSFDQHIEALEKSGVLSAGQLEVLKSIQTQVRAREGAVTMVKETPRKKTYTNSELVSLRPPAASSKVTTGIAKKFAEQQDAFLIGEHISKTRYHTASSLTQDFEKLSITDKKPANPPIKNLQKIETSKVNPFGPKKGKGLSTPAHPWKQTATADHGAEARVQHSSGNNVLAPTSNQHLPMDFTSTIRPPRRNMINQTGFIALAENRVNVVAASNEGEHPLIVTGKKGL